MPQPFFFYAGLYKDRKVLISLKKRPGRNDQALIIDFDDIDYRL